MTQLNGLDNGYHDDDLKMIETQLKQDINVNESWNCSTIYLDLGSNIGVQIRKLFEPDKYSPNSTKVKTRWKNALIGTLSYFDNILGAIDHRRKYCCSFGFEANPNHEIRLKEIETCYNKKNWKTKFDIKAVLDTNDEIVPIYTHPTNPDEDWGAGMIQYNKRSKTHANVSTIDIAKWILHIITIYKPQHILIKMDIEGAEFKALPRMLEMGILCKKYIDVILMEVHPPYGIKMGASFNMYRFINETVPKQQCEATKIVILDDESYLHDEQPMPAECLS